MTKCRTKNSCLGGLRSVERNDELLVEPPSFLPYPTLSKAFFQAVDLIFSDQRKPSDAHRVVPRLRLQTSKETIQTLLRHPIVPQMGKT
jgi:hypothetical protein